MLDIINYLQEEVKTFKTNLTNTTTKNGQRKRKNISKYFWSHVACTYSIKGFNIKFNGHKHETTFCDKMVGIIYCFKFEFGME